MLVVVAIITTRKKTAVFFFRLLCVLCAFVPSSLLPVRRESSQTATAFVLSPSSNSAHKLRRRQNHDVGAGRCSAPSPSPVPFHPPAATESASARRRRRTTSTTPWSLSTTTTSSTSLLVASSLEISSFGYEEDDDRIRRSRSATATAAVAALPPRPGQQQQATTTDGGSFLPAVTARTTTTTTAVTGSFLLGLFLLLRRFVQLPTATTTASTTAVAVAVAASTGSGGVVSPRPFLPPLVLLLPGFVALSLATTAVVTSAWQVLFGNNPYLLALLPSASLSLDSVYRVLSQGIQQSLVWYMARLHENPVVTKSVTAGAIGVAGDYAAQTIERMIFRRKKEKVTGGTEQHHHHHQHHRYDRRRGISVLLDGALLSGPLMHFAYELFESVGSANSSSLAAIFHVLADSIVLDSFFIATTFVVTGLMEGYSRKQLIPQLKSDYVPTLFASWVTSIGLLPVQFACFRYLPVPLRVLGVNCIDVVWGAVISFFAHRHRESPSEAAAPERCVGDNDNNSDRQEEEFDDSNFWLNAAAGVVESDVVVAARRQHPAVAF